MSIIRGARPNLDCTIIPNAVLQDSRLSFLARGVLAYLLSLPEGERLSHEDISAAGRPGGTSLAAVMAELRVAGYLATQNDDAGNAAEVVSEVASGAPVPPAKPKEKTKTAARPEGVTDRTWHDYLELRKRHKAPLTETALAGLEREATRAGWTLEDALRECCFRGWRGFKAEWVAARETPYARSMRERYEQAAPRAAVRMPQAVNPNTYFDQLEA